VTGYRDSLFYKVWFWESPKLTLYFWGLTLAIFAFGAIVFRRLRPHFADVL
jgi:lipopolysaccharide transport system permease protein